MRTIDMSRMMIVAVALITLSLLLLPAGMALAREAPGSEEAGATTVPDTGPRDPPPLPTGFGPYQRGYMNVQIPRTDNIPVASRIYYPAGATGHMTPVNTSGAPWPTIVYLSGGNGTYHYCNGISQRISSWGYVVLNVELANVYGNPGLRNPESMAEETSDVIDYIENQTVNGSFFLNGMMDEERLGISGHSWGGLGAGLAVTDELGDPRFDVAVPMSSTMVPGDQYKYWREHSKDVHIPMELISGSIGDNNLQSLLEHGNPPVTYIVVIGANHGGVLGHHQWPVAFFKYWLENETSYEHWVYTEGIRAEDDAGNISLDTKLFTAWGNLSSTEILEDRSVDFDCHLEGRTYGEVEFKWDHDGDATFDWNSSGPGTSEMTYTEEGSYIPRLVVEDMYERKNIRYHLNVTNVPPVPVLGPDRSVVEDGTVRLNASLSYDTPSDNDTLEFRWDLGDGTVLEYDDIPGISHVYPEAGEYTVTLWVRDDDWDEVNVTRNITVLNLAPTVEVMDDVEVVEDTPVDLIGTGNDTRSDLEEGLEYYWDLGDGNRTQWGPDPVATHTYVTAGNYTAILHVRDIDGSETVNSTTVRVRNLAPTAIIIAPGPGESYPMDTEVEFQASAEDTPSDSPWLEYSWDLGDGRVVPWGQRTVLTHTYTGPGEYDVIFRARDPDGAVTVSEIDLIVTNPAPGIELVEGSGSVTVDEDESLDLAVSVSDTPSHEGNLTVSWLMGKGGDVLEGLEISYTFTRSGTYGVVANVTDDAGASSSLEVTVEVRNRRPSATAGIDGNSILEGEAINFTATVSDTPSDEAAGLHHTWDFDDGSATVSALNGSHVFEEAGTYRVVFTVTDDDGSTAEVENIVTVRERIDGGGGNGDDGEEGLSGVLLAGIGAVIVIVAILVFLLFFRLGSRSGPDPWDEEPPPEREEDIGASARGSEGAGWDLDEEKEPDIDEAGDTDPGDEVAGDRGRDGNGPEGEDRTVGDPDETDPAGPGPDGPDQREDVPGEDDPADDTDEALGPSI